MKITDDTVENTILSIILGRGNFLMIQCSKQNLGEKDENFKNLENKTEFPEVSKMFQDDSVLEKKEFLKFKILYMDLIWYSSMDKKNHMVLMREKKIFEEFPLFDVCFWNIFFHQVHEFQNLFFRIRKGFYCWHRIGKKR